MDGPWLLWAANKRGLLLWFVEFGQAHGFPVRIELWSKGMVKLAVDARLLVPTTTKGASR